MANRFMWFLAGSICAAVVLYVTWWKGGVLEPYMSRVRAESRPPVATRAVTRDRSGDSDRVNPHAAAPPAAIPDNLAAIVPPIEGMQASDILDTFNQGRPGGRTHQATDIMEPRLTPVHAMVDGVIKKLFLSKPGGNTIYEFDEAEQYCYYYAHLDRYADGLQEGRHVSRGDLIGYVGSTGDADANAPHLHLAINVLAPDKHWWQGTPINPYPILMRTLGR